MEIGCAIRLSQRLLTQRGTAVPQHPARPNPGLPTDQRDRVVPAPPPSGRARRNGNDLGADNVERCQCGGQSAAERAGDIRPALFLERKNRLPGGSLVVHGGRHRESAGQGMRLGCHRKPGPARVTQRPIGCSASRALDGCEDRECVEKRRENCHRSSVCDARPRQCVPTGSVDYCWVARIVAETPRFCHPLERSCCTAPPVVIRRSESSSLPPMSATASEVVDGSPGDPPTR